MCPQDTDALTFQTLSQKFWMNRQMENLGGIKSYLGKTMQFPLQYESGIFWDLQRQQGQYKSQSEFFYIMCQLPIKTDIKQQAQLPNPQDYGLITIGQTYLYYYYTWVYIKKDYIMA